MAKLAGFAGSPFVRRAHERKSVPSSQMKSFTATAHNAATSPETPPPFSSSPATNEFATFHHQETLSHEALQTLVDFLA